MDTLAPQVEHLLTSIRRLAGSDFTGIGLVFYRAPMRLPCRSLGDQALFEEPLPVAGGEARMAQVLAGISRRGSPWHDGFHLIDADSFQLTHVCQFASPPLALLPVPAAGQAPVGARWQSAVALSRLPGVRLTALISSRGEPFIFEDGHERQPAKPDPDRQGI
jgi:hypothetical protein